MDTAVLPWLEQKLAENGNKVASRDELLAKIIELEDNAKTMEDQVIHAMFLAEFWRNRAGGSAQTDPFPWEGNSNG